MSKHKQFPDKTALALSGGGYRATLFHIGTLLRLNEEGLLPQFKTISSISGGSITGAWLGLKWKELNFDGNGVADNICEVVVGPLRKLCSKDIDTGPTLTNLLLMLGGGVSNDLADNYKKHLFGDSWLVDLPSANEGPDFIFLTSNIQTDSRVWISKSRLWHERLGLIRNPEIPLCEVVAMSSGLPPFLSPIFWYTKAHDWEPDEQADLYNEVELREKLILADGGIHDPSGVEPVFDDHDCIVVSDANISKEVWKNPSTFWIRQVGRSTILQTFANRETRRRLIERCACAMEEHKVIWFALTDEIAKIGIEKPLTGDSKKTRELGCLRTRLGPFTPEEQGGLINWGYALCDAKLKQSGHIDPTETSEPTWPVKEFPL